MLKKRKLVKAARNIKKIEMTVYCFAKDAGRVRSSLFDWFCGNEHSLVNYKSSSGYPATFKEYKDAFEKLCPYGL